MNPAMQSLYPQQTSQSQSMNPQQSTQFQQPQQYDFSGWGDRLNKIEQGIAGLTDQFNNFQAPGDVAPEYQGNTAPEPLGQSANAPEPLGGIESLLAPAQNTGFNFDPSGGSLFDQMSAAYGQPATLQQQFQGQNPDADYILKGGQNFTQGFQDYIAQQGYYTQNNSAMDAGMNISQTPTQDYGIKSAGFWDKMKQSNPNFMNNQPFQTLAGPSGGKMAGGVGAGLTGLASYQQNKGPGI